MLSLLCAANFLTNIFFQLWSFCVFIFFLSPALSFPFFLPSFILPLLFNLLSLFTFSSLKLHWVFYLCSTVAYSGVELKRPRPLTVLFWWPRFSCSLSHPHPPLSSSCPPSLTPSYNSPSDCYEWGINSSCSFNQWGPLVLSLTCTPSCCTRAVSQRVIIPERAKLQPGMSGTVGEGGHRKQGDEEGEK